MSTGRPPLLAVDAVAGVGDAITYRLPRGPVRRGVVWQVMRGAYIVDVRIPATARGREAYRTRTVVRAGWLVDAS